MPRQVWWMIIVGLLIVGNIYLFLRECPARPSPMTQEHFTGSPEETIIRTYEDILNRKPTSKELANDARDLADGTLTLESLEQKLITSDEYERMMKLQSNVLTPELPRVLADRDLLQRITLIYREERKMEPPPKMLGPLRDIYILLGYSDDKFRAFLRQAAYERFEQDVLANPDMSKEDLIALFHDRFDMKAIDAEAEKIRKARLAKEAKNKNGGSGSCPSPCPAMQACPARSIHDKDSDSSEMLAALLQQGAFASGAAGIDVPAGAMKIYQPKTHEGDMVLRPEFAWSVPQPRQPICYSLGQKPLIQPMFSSSSHLLLGTPLGDAADTGVGTMMPNFEHREFTSVPLPSDIQSYLKKHGVTSSNVVPPSSK